MRMSWPLLLAIPASLVACKSDKRDVTVSWSDVKQTIDGFGASTAFFGGKITDEQADMLFDAKKGLGLSLLRTMIGVPDDTQDDGSQPTEGAQSIATAPELNTAQQAYSRGAQVWATAWTPPPIWKTTNNKRGSGEGYDSNKLKPEHYQDYANYLADFVDLVARNGVPLLGLSPANEPDYTATWDGAQWTPEELTNFIAQNLGPTFAQRASSVKIIAPDTANFPACDQYVTAILANSTAAGYVPIMATHPYSGDGNIGREYQKPQQHGKAFWETEWSQENMDGDTPDPSMTSALDMARQIHDNMTITNMNAWNWWSIYITQDGLNDDKRLNPAFMQPDKSMGEPFMFKRGYAFGNWSKFVRPGFTRIGANDRPTDGVLIEAYRDDTHLAVIAVNRNGKTVTQKFVMEDGNFGTLTPWVTSDADSLAAKSPITPVDNVFTYDLPARSVVTFVNWDATTETPKQGSLPVVKSDAAVDSRSTTGGLDCSNAIVPGNLGEGGVTDFTDWKGSSGKWGDEAGLWGNVYGYAATTSTMKQNVDTAAKTLHGTGTLVSGDYAGIGLSFSVCATVTSFSQVQFTVSGAWEGCDMELQMKTFDQQPIDQTPAGGCYQDASAGCYNFPVKKKVAVPSTEPTTVLVPLGDLSNWSPDNAAQVVGMQWQFTAATPDPDAGTSTASSGCDFEVNVTGIKFLP